MLSDMDLLSARTLGGVHTQMQLRSSGNTQSRPLEAIFFNMGTDKPPPNRFHRMACHIRWNRWRDRKNLQLIIRGFMGP
jgi:hypothetical protein